MIDKKTKVFRELQFLSKKELAQHLGVSIRTISRWVDAGKLIQPIRIGRLLMWSVHWITEWMNCNCPDCQTWEAMKKKSTSANQ